MSCHTVLCALNRPRSLVKNVAMALNDMFRFGELLRSNCYRNHRGKLSCVATRLLHPSGTNKETWLRTIPIGLQSTAHTPDLVVASRTVLHQLFHGGLAPVSSRMRIDRGGCRTRVTQILLHLFDRGSRFQRVGGMSVTQPVR